MATLETTPDCLATPRIALALEELGAPYDVVVYPNGHFEATYGVIGPAWVEGEFRLFEGNPILRHVGRAYGAFSLMPSDLEGQARVDGWLDFIVVRIAMSMVRGLPEKAMEYLKVVDRHLADREWLCEAFSVADCGYVTLVQMGERIPMQGLPNLQAYLARLSARPAVARANERLAVARVAAG